MQKGFTLIELMTVIVIIGILAAIGLPNYFKTIDKAKVVSVISNMYTMELTVEEMSVDSSGIYPRTSVTIANELPHNFKNPYTQGTGQGEVWDITNDIVNESDIINTINKPGAVIYGVTTAGDNYFIKGYGKDPTKEIDLIITSGKN